MLGGLYRVGCVDTNFNQRPDQNETSLAVVPRNHALLSIPNLEAESSGLLDRLLGVFQEETRYEDQFILRVDQDANTNQ